MNCRLSSATRSLRRAAATQAIAQTAQVASHPDPLTPAPADEALAPAKSFPEVALQPAIFDWTKSHLHECKQPFNITNAGTIAALPTNHRMEGAVPEVAAFTTAMGVPNALVHVPEGTTAEHHVSAIQALLNLRRKHDWELSKMSEMMMQNALAHTKEVETMAELMRVQQEEAKEEMRVQQEAMRVQQEAMRVQQEAARIEREAMRVQQEDARVRQEEARDELAFTVLCPFVALVSRQFTEQFAKNPQVDVPAALKGFDKVRMTDLSRQFRCNLIVFGRFHGQVQLAYAHPNVSWDDMIRFVNIETSEFERVLRIAIKHSSEDPEVVHFLTCLFEAMKTDPTIRPRLETGG